LGGFALAVGDRAAIEACIVCGSAEVEPFLALGQMALANKFLTREELSGDEPRFDLTVGFCHECSHVQLTRHGSPARMFEDYLHISSASDTLKDHLWDLSDVVVQRCGLGEGDLVIDIGANDGTLLKGFRRHGVQALGVDPARNLAERYRDPEIARYTGFLQLSLGRGDPGAVPSRRSDHRHQHLSSHPCPAGVRPWRRHRSRPGRVVRH